MKPARHVRPKGNGEWSFSITRIGFRSLVEGVAFSPDGKQVALVGLTEKGPGGLKVWELAAARPLDVALAHEGMVMAATFSPDSNLLATSEDTIRVRTYNDPKRVLRRRA